MLLKPPGKPTPYNDLAKVYVNLYNTFCNKHIPNTPQMKARFNSVMAPIRALYSELTVTDFAACILWCYKTNPAGYLSIASYGTMQTFIDMLPQFCKWRRNNLALVKESGLDIYQYVEQNCTTVEDSGVSVEEFDGVFKARSRKIQTMGKDNKYSSQ